MCKLKFTREHLGCYALVILVIVLLIGVLFGLRVFRHGYDHLKEIGRNHTCYDCNRHGTGLLAPRCFQRACGFTGGG